VTSNPDSAKPLRLYWSSGLKSGKKNFGDWLSPRMCEVLSGRKVEYARPRKADMVAIGSILHRIPDKWWSHRLDVWGTGFMQEYATQRAIHRYHAVRGHLTAVRLHGKVDLKAFGDPGLLVDMLLPNFKAIEKTAKIGVIPHRVDQGCPELVEFLKNFPQAKMIDILSETDDFLKQVVSCELILSSSLHGLVTADAFGIPNAWLKLSENVRGEGFKFRDYYSVFNIVNPEPLKLSDINNFLVQKLIEEYWREGIDSTKRDLKKSFPYQAKS